eukprot:TRINITY_DN54684_c0_g1_i1.p1 TRINITY_DN54684_c0_g1~~TRINITY_DN54684_c0_g1_i1.p1  ORF type:complete len:584 (-),score=32.47 TRINITY_DN54684_c0_g1_i1:177-1844(-)
MIDEESAELDQRMSMMSLTPGATGLILACSSGQLLVAQILLHAGARVDLQDDLGCTALMYACNMGFLDVVQLLFDAGANIHTEFEHQTRDKGNVYTPVMVAVISNQVDIVEYLVAKGADPNQATTSTTPLVLAILKNHLSAIEALIYGGADVNQPVYEIQSRYLFFEQDEWAVRLLRGHPPAIRQTASVSSLGTAAYSGFASVPATTNTYKPIKTYDTSRARTPLYIAAGFGRLPIVQLLLRADAEVTAKVLTVAINRYHTDVVAALIATGVDNTQLNSHYSSLVTELRQRSLEEGRRRLQHQMMECLYSFGANVNLENLLRFYDRSIIDELAESEGREPIEMDSEFVVVNVEDDAGSIPSVSSNPNLDVETNHRPVTPPSGGSNSTSSSNRDHHGNATPKRGKHKSHVPGTPPHPSSQFANTEAARAPSQQKAVHLFLCTLTVKEDIPSIVLRLEAYLTKGWRPEWHHLFPKPFRTRLYTLFACNKLHPLCAQEIPASCLYTILQYSNYPTQYYNDQEEAKKILMPVEQKSSGGFWSKIGRSILGPGEKGTSSR